MIRNSTHIGRILLVATAPVAVAATIAATTTAATAAAAAAPSRTAVTGSWVDDVPCTPTDVHPNPFHPTTLKGRCTGSSVWSGSFDGVTHYTTHGTTDLVTGDSRARIKETFIGVDSATDKVGTLHLKGTVVQDGSTLTMVVKERVTGGTGAFAKAHGHLRYEGVDTSLVGGAGGYRGLLH
jgi:hypothetical protein